jgi:hypothetical protein
LDKNGSPRLEAKRDRAKTAASRRAAASPQQPAAPAPQRQAMNVAVSGLY